MAKNNYITVALFLCDEVTGWPIRESIHLVTIEDGESDHEKSDKLLTQYERIVEDYGKK